MKVGEELGVTVDETVGADVALFVGAAVGDDVFIETNNVGEFEGYPTTLLVGAKFVLWFTNKGLEVG